MSDELEKLIFGEDDKLDPDFGPVTLGDADDLDMEDHGNLYDEHIRVVEDLKKQLAEKGEEITDLKARLKPIDEVYRMINERVADGAYKHEEIYFSYSEMWSAIRKSQEGK
jgi:hypothetical protein